MESKKVSHLGNENFMKGVLIKDHSRVRESWEIRKLNDSFIKNSKLTMKEIVKIEEHDSPLKSLNFTEISEDKLRKNY